MLKVRILFFSFFSIFCSTALLAMEWEEEEEENEEMLHSASPRNPSKELCSHWGLSHWIHGIWEYPQRCFCCYDGVSQRGSHISLIRENEKSQKEYDALGIDVFKSRYYKYNNNSYYEVHDSSDCFCVDMDNEYCNNPITGTLLCPLVTLGHIFCLPFMLFERSENPQTRFYYKQPYVYVPRQEPPKGHYEFVRSAGNSDIGRNLSETGNPDLMRIWVPDK